MYIKVSIYVLHTYHKYNETFDYKIQFESSKKVTFKNAYLEPLPHFGFEGQQRQLQPKKWWFQPLKIYFSLVHLIFFAHFNILQFLMYNDWKYKTKNTLNCIKSFLRVYWIFIFFAKCFLFNIIKILQFCFKQKVFGMEWNSIKKFWKNQCCR